MATADDARGYAARAARAGDDTAHRYEPIAVRSSAPQRPMRSWILLAPAILGAVAGVLVLLPSPQPPCQPWSAHGAVDATLAPPATTGEPAMTAASRDVDDPDSFAPTPSASSAWAAARTAPSTASGAPHARLVGGILLGGKILLPDASVLIPDDRCAAARSSRSLDYEMLVPVRAPGHLERPTPLPSARPPAGLWREQPSGRRRQP